MLFELSVMQAPATSVPGWVGPTIAIATSISALAFIVMGIVAFVTGKALVHASRSVAGTIDGLQSNADQTLTTIRDLAEDGREITASVRDETKALVKTSKRMRKRLRRGTDRLQERLEDVDALYEVVYDEVEDTALGVAATLRTAKRARRMLSPLSRLWRRRRR